jgi:hypothetical protein
MIIERIATHNNYSQKLTDRKMFEHKKMFVNTTIDYYNKLLKNEQDKRNRIQQVNNDADVKKYEIERRFDQKKRKINSKFM